MQTINVNYFALFRDLADKSSESIKTDAKTTADLYRQLKLKYDFPLSQCKLKVAVNDEFTGFDYELKANDKVVFIPPVAGG
jgi:molybdopterin converting factor small subunit